MIGAHDGNDNNHGDTDNNHDDKHYDNDRLAKFLFKSSGLVKVYDSYVATF